MGAQKVESVVGSYKLELRLVGFVSLRAVGGAYVAGANSVHDAVHHDSNCPRDLA